MPRLWRRKWERSVWIHASNSEFPESKSHKVASDWVDTHYREGVELYEGKIEIHGVFRLVLRLTHDNVGAVLKQHESQKCLEERL